MIPSPSTTMASDKARANRSSGPDPRQQEQTDGRHPRADHREDLVAAPPADR